MAFVYADRVKEESTSVGLSSMILTGAVPGFQDFTTGVGDGNETYYTIFNGGDDTWEVGVGTYSVGTVSLSRDTVLASSNGGASVTFAAGTKIVFAAVAAQFFGNTLSALTHSSINHTGIPGVPAPETFNASDHSLVDHTGIPFNLLDGTAHNAINHKAAPFNLLDETNHDVLDHTGLAGINNFDTSQHALTNHAGLLGVPGAETFTSPVHAGTNHAGIPGIGSGKVVQQVRTRISTIVTCNSGTPLWDNSVPQQTEGTEVITLAITPQSTSNTLTVRFSGWGGGDPSRFWIVSLFKDADPGAIAAVSSVDYIAVSGATDRTFHLDHYLTVPSTVPQTYKIRIGGNGTLYINGHSTGSALLGGVAYSSLTITEIAP